MKRIAITKCDIFFIIAIPKKSDFAIFAIQNFVQNTKKQTWISFMFWDHISKVNEWCLVDCFHHEFRLSIQIMVYDDFIAKCKRFFVCGWLLACNFTKINTPPWVFFTFFKLYKWYQNAQRIKFVPVFYLIYIFWQYYGNTFELKKFLLTLRYIEIL